MQPLLTMRAHVADRLQITFAGYVHEIKGTHPQSSVFSTVSNDTPHSIAISSLLFPA